MHCLFGKGYAGGGGHLCFGMEVFAVASSDVRCKSDKVISDGISLLSSTG
jgi:hypothetical protein